MERGTGRSRGSSFPLLPSTIADPSLGFTLIELIFVMAILSILLIASIPQFQRARERLLAEQSAVELTQLLRMAHERAMAEGHPVAWTWDSTARRARVAASAAPSEPGQSPDERPSQSRPIPDGFALTVTRGDAPVDCACVAFFADGTSGTGAGLPIQIRLQREALDYTIRVDASTSQVLLGSGTPAR